MEIEFLTERPRPALAKVAPSDLGKDAAIAYWCAVIETVGNVAWTDAGPRIELVGYKSFLQEFVRLVNQEVLAESFADGDVPSPSQRAKAPTTAAYYRGIREAEPPQQPAVRARLKVNADPEAWYRVVTEPDVSKTIAQALGLRPEAEGGGAIEGG